VQQLFRNKLPAVLRNTGAAFVLALAPTGAVRADHTGIEYEVKAAYPYNFVRFIDWPRSSLSDEDDRISVCVLGEDPFGHVLDPLTRRTAKGRSFRVSHGDSLDEIGRCHVVFVGAGTPELRSVLETLAARSVLTVGETPDFAKRGGVIGFIVRDGRVRLQINRKAAARAALSIRAALLEVAELIE
jgi:hypothetical protein